MKHTPGVSIDAKVCSKCAVVKPFSQFWKDARQRDGLKAQCSACTSANNKDLYATKSAIHVENTDRWRKHNPERFRETSKGYRHATKRRFVDGYGGKCTCCGEPHIEFLTVEHVHGGGEIHRRAKKINSHGVYLDAIREGFPPEYTVLCLNCNHARRHGGKCPHETAPPDETKTTMLAALKGHDAYMSAQFSGTDSEALHPNARANWINIRAAIALASPSIK